MQLLNLSSFQIDKGQFKRFSSDFERHRADRSSSGVGCRCRSRHVTCRNVKWERGCPELEDAPASFIVWCVGTFWISRYLWWNKTIYRTATVCMYCTTCIQYANFSYISYAEVYSGVLKIKRKNNKNRTEPKTVTLKPWYEPNRGFCEPYHP